MSGQITSHMHGQTLVLTLSNPGARNALNPAMYAAAVEALTVASDSKGVRSIVFAGEGDTFCVGGQLQRLQTNRELAPEVQSASVDALHAWIDAIRTCPKPVVAAVEGAAAGAGFSIALACDMVVSSRDAVFSMAYVNVGLTPDGGATWHLARALPRAVATEMLIDGGKWSAERLHGLGLINRLTLPGQALRDALEWCEQLNQKAPNAIESIKELLNSATGQDFPAQLAAEQSHFVKNLHHPNAGEGIAAFLQKRKPDFC